MRGVRRWLTPGMGIKRWLALVFLGELALALGGALVLRQVYREIAVTGPLQAAIYLVTLQFLPYELRALALVLVGGVLAALGFGRLMGVLVGPSVSSEPLSEVIYQRRLLARGPRIVAVGGGTGLSILLRGLKERTSNLTAIVSVADDGGSSGRLRAAYGWIPMGDIRNCIAALADAEPLMTSLLQYRFPEDPGKPGLSGHAFGNLLIAAMSDVEGDFEEGVRQVNRVLAVRGEVLPASDRPLTLHAVLADGIEVEGQSRIARIRGIDHVWIEPREAPACAGAVEAIGAADLIVVGPGSLYTSILPNLLVPAIGQAVRQAPGLVVYVCNVATQIGETEGYDLADHVLALERHAGPRLVDVVLANSALEAHHAPGDATVPVQLEWPPARESSGLGQRRPDVQLALRDVVDRANPHHHDPDRLAAALVEIAEQHVPRRAVAAARSA